MTHKQAVEKTVIGYRKYKERTLNDVEQDSIKNIEGKDE